VALTPEELQQMITLQRQVAWQYDLDAFTTKELKRIQGAVNKAKVNIVDYMQKRGSDIGAWTGERLDDVMNELEALTIGVQGQVTDDISTLYSSVGEQAIAAQNNMLSFGSRVPGFNFVALSAAQLKSFASTTQVGGQQLNYWVKREFTKAMQEELRREVLAGMLQGEGYPQFLKRLEGRFNTFNRRELTTLVRTYVQDANVQAQKAVYAANPDVVRLVEWSAVLEPGYIRTGRGTCPRCAALDGNQYDMDDHPAIPLHPRCRCILLPVTASYRELGLDIDEIQKAYRPYTIRPNKNVDTGGRRKILEVGFHQGSYDSWFAKRPRSFQRNVIGPKRLELVESGKVKFKQLVSEETGRLYTLEELQDFIEDGFPPRGAAKFAKMPPAEKEALKKKLLDKGPYPDLDSLAPLNGREVKMLASGLDIPTFGRNRIAIQEDIVKYYQKKIVKPPPVRPPPGPITPPPTPAVVGIDDLNKMSWSELRKFGSQLGIKGKHGRDKWNRLILEKVGGTSKVVKPPTVVKPPPAPSVPDYKNMSWKDVRAYARDLGIKGKHKRPELEGLIAEALEKKGNPKVVQAAVEKVVSPKPAKLNPLQAYQKQEAEYKQFFIDNPEFKPYEKWRKNKKYHQAFKQSHTSSAFKDAAPVLAQRQRLLSARADWMRWLKETNYDEWVLERKNILRKQIKFNSNPLNPNKIPKGSRQEKMIARAFKGTQHIDDGLFIELDSSGLTWEIHEPWKVTKVGQKRPRAFYSGYKNQIRVYESDDYITFAHEYGHGVDKWLSGQSSSWGSDSGRLWTDNMIASRKDAKLYRKLFDKQKTGQIGTYANGDGEYWVGDWIRDYEGRIYGGRTGRTVGEQFWAMGSQRYAQFYDQLDRTRRAGQLGDLTDIKKKFEAAEKEYYNAQRRYGLTAQTTKKAKQEALQYRQILEDAERGVKSANPEDFAVKTTEWGKQVNRYPEYAKLQRRLYETKWDHRNDPLWKHIEAEEAKWLDQKGLSNVEKANVAASEFTIPERVVSDFKPPDFPVGDLGEFEVDALATYTLHSKEINRLLRSGKSFKDAGLYPRLIKGIDSAVKKLPSYKGKVYRGYHDFFMKKGRINFYKALEEGAIFEDNSWMSSSLDPAVPDKFGIGKADTIFEINAKNAKVIQPYSSQSKKAEWEVMFKRGTKFKITKIERRGKQLYVTMDEV